MLSRCFFFQAEDGIRDLVRSRGLGDVYKRQTPIILAAPTPEHRPDLLPMVHNACQFITPETTCPCLLYTSDAADERSSVDLGGRRIIKKKTKQL